MKSYLPNLIIKVVSLIILGLIVFSHSAYASFEFTPIIANLKPSGSGSSQAFTVKNTGKNRIPIQISLVAREPDHKGKEVYNETDKVSEMFRIFPSQLVLKPNEIRTVRVRYIGSPKVKTELPFRIIAEELAVNVSDPKKKYKKAVAQINITTKYVGSLYVTPSGAKANVVVDVKRIKGNKKLLLTLTNKGTLHQVLRTPKVTLQSLTGGKQILLTGDDAKSLMNQNVLPNKTRKFTLDWPKDLPIGPAKATIEYSKR